MMLILEGPSSEDATKTPWRKNDEDDASVTGRKRGRIALITTPEYRHTRPQLAEGFVYKYLYQLCHHFEVLARGDSSARDERREAASRPRPADLPAGHRC